MSPREAFVWGLGTGLGIAVMYKIISAMPPKLSAAVALAGAGCALWLATGG